MNSLLAWLLATCAAIATVAVLRPIVRRYCGAIAVLNLWWIVPLSFAAALIPKKITVPVFISTSQVTTTSTTTPATAIAPSGLPWTEISLGVWAVGTFIACLWMFISHRSFTRRIDWRLGRRGMLPAECGPAAVGAWRPRLALPVDFKSRYTAAERKLILLHEHVHLRRRDGLTNLAMSILLALQWFNPLVYWASRALGRDQESACDAIVISRYPQALRTYAEALLKSLPGMPQHLPLVCRWQAHHPIIERISMLKTHRDLRAKKALAVMLFAGGAALGGALAYAAQPTTLETTTIEAAAAPYQITVSLDTRKSDPSTPGQVSTTSRKFDVAARDGERFEVDLPGKMRVAMRANAEPSGKGIRVDTEIEDTVTQKVAGTILASALTHAAWPASAESLADGSNGASYRLKIMVTRAQPSIATPGSSPRDSFQIISRIKDNQLTRADIRDLRLTLLAKSYGDNLLVESQIESLPEQKMLASPKMLVKFGEQASIEIGQADDKIRLDFTAERVNEKVAYDAPLSSGTQPTTTGNATCKFNSEDAINALAIAFPPGVITKSLNRAGIDFELVGYAQDPAGVARVMRTLEKSKTVFANPLLRSIRDVTVDGKSTKEFELSFSLKCGDAPASI